MNIKKNVFFLFLLFLSLNLMSQDYKTDEHKRVLLLFSGSHEYLINRQIFLALDNELRESDIKLFAEYIGDNNSVYTRDKATFIRFFQEKYGSVNKFDIVVAYNSKAIEFCEDFGQVIFPNTKILNLDIYNKNIIKTTIIKELELIKELHPNLEHLLVISDKSLKGQIMKTYLENYLVGDKSFQEKVLYIDFSKLAFSEISKYEYYSQKNSIVLLLSAYQDKDFAHMDFPEQVDFLNESLALPIYTFYEKNEGIALGGYYSNLDTFAKNLSIKIMLILNNLPLNEIDLSNIEEYQLYLNNKVANNFQIDIASYRDNALVLENDELSKTVMIKALRLSFYISYILFIILLIINYLRQKKYKKELNRSQNILTQISNKSYQYIFVVAKDTGLIVDYNLKVTQSDFADMIMKKESRLLDFFPKEILDIINKGKDRQGKLFDLEFTAGKVTFPVIISLIDYQDGQNEFVIVEFFNNSKVKHEMLELKRKIEESEKQIFESKNLIEGFIREIRDPLNVKNGFQELLDKETFPDLQRNDYHEIVKSNSDKLLRLIEKILVYSEINKNTRSINNQEFSVNECIRENIAQIQKEAVKSGRLVKIVNYFSLSDQKDILFNDKKYFCLVFREILENAVKFTPKGVIECGYTHPSDGKIIFYVKDSGLGMTKEEEHHAFEKFNHPQENNLKTSLTGMGLGLAICRNIISKMGGSIWLTSNEGKGTTVYFYLDFDMSIFKDFKNHLRPKEISQLQARHICIIDEDLGSQKFISQLLMKNNISSRLMPHGNFYEKYINSNKQCDLIIFDYESGFKDFFSKNKQILKDAKVTIILMTRSIIDDDLTKNLTDFDYYIIYKPLKLEELVNALIAASARKLS